jgi:sec-independent protein translocase protein TatC
MEKKRTDPDSLTLIGHLDELRVRIFYCIGFVVAAAFLSISFSKQIIEFLKIPASNIIPDFIVLKPTEVISVYIKVSLVAGIIIASPALFYQFWKFIRPVIEKRLQSGIIKWVISAAILFFIGTLFMYEIVLPFGLNFLMKMTEGIATPMITLNAYISFVLAIIFIGGVIFEIPVISGILTSAGIITPFFMRKKRKEAVFFLFLIAAVITPTVDIFNMLLFALPMILLYEASIIVSMVIYKSKIQNKTEEIYAIEN